MNASRTPVEIFPPLMPPMMLVAGSALLTGCAGTATAVIRRSRIARNRNDWGAIATEGNLRLEQSTVDNNVGVYAGGLWIGSQPESPVATTVLSSTFSGNSGHTGAIWCEDPGDAPDLLELRDVTVAFNRAADAGWSGWLVVGGLQAAECHTRVSNTIVARNEPRDCGRDRPDIDEVNLDSDGDCVGFKLHADPELGSLRDNGGPTPTQMPSAGSPVIDSGTVCERVDQRGVARTDRLCDIGSVEAP